jgi:hypothetical protein
MLNVLRKFRFAAQSILDANTLTSLAVVVDGAVKSVIAGAGDERILAACGGMATVPSAGVAIVAIHPKPNTASRDAVIVLSANVPVIA